jgi:catechol 2,3-dioxygenase-like lactoylglutathione lyase family enzyme
MKRSQQMASGPRLDSAVMFVQDLDRSVSFYQQILGLKVADRSPTAALLHSYAGSQLILRSMGSAAVHTLGGVGVQYLIWTAADEEDLDRCERVLKELSAHRDTRVSGGVKAVEGRDPDDIVLVITYPGPDQLPLHELPVRIYGW